MCFYHLYVAWVGTADALILRSVHLGFALIITFLVFPTNLQGKRKLAFLTNSIFIFLSITIAGYVIVEYEYFINRMMYVDTLKPQGGF